MTVIEGVKAALLLDSLSFKVPIVPLGRFSRFPHYCYDICIFGVYLP